MMPQMGQVFPIEGAKEMTLRRFGLCAIDLLAVLVGLAIAAPFVLVIVAPFLPGM